MKSLKFWFALIAIVWALTGLFGCSVAHKLPDCPTYGAHKAGFAHSYNSPYRYR